MRIMCVSRTNISFTTFCFCLTISYKIYIWPFCAKPRLVIYVNICIKLFNINQFLARQSPAQNDIGQFWYLTLKFNHTFYVINIILSLDTRYHLEEHVCHAILKSTHSCLIQTNCFVKFKQRNNRLISF